METINLPKTLLRSLAILLSLCILFITLPSFVIAADTGSVTISNLVYPSSTLSEGDTFSLNFTFYPSQSTKLKGITLSGDAVNTSSATSDIYIGDSAIETDTEIGAGSIVTVSYTNLTYTGKGSTVTITVNTENCGSATSTIELKVLTQENVQGALILDQSETNNLSLSMSAGESKKFSLQIKNVASESIKNGVAKVYFESTTTGLSVVDGQYTTLSSLSSNGTKDLSFTLAATSQVKSGTYKLVIELNSMKQTVNVAIDSDATPPALELSINENSTFNLGSTNPLTLYIKNTGSKAAKNIKVTLVNSSEVAVVGTSNVKNITSLASGEQTSYSSKLQLDSSISSNLLLLTINLSYSDESGENYTDTQTIYLNTNSTQSTNDLVISNINSPSGTYTPDSHFNVSFKVSSKYGAENVKISIKPADGIIATSQSVFVLTELAAAQSQTYTVSLSAKDNVSTGNYPIEILLDYDYEGKSFSMSQYASVNISNEETDEDQINPKVILSALSTSADVVDAGDEMTFFFTFLNTHSAKSIYNLTATLDYSTTGSTTNVFRNASSTNTLFASLLTAGQSYSQSMTVGTSASATPGSYTLSLKLSYQDENGQEFSSTESIPVTINQNISMDIAEIDLSSLTIGRSTSLTATIYNTSKSDASNVMIYLESDALDTGFSVTDNKTYLSSFGIGATEYYAPTLTGLVGGNYEVTLVIDYEDQLGNAHSLRHPFTLTVMDTTNSKGGMSGSSDSMDMQGMGSRMGNSPANMNQDSSTSTWLIGGIALIVFAALIILFKAIRKRKQLKEFNLNE